MASSFLKERHSLAIFNFEGKIPVPSDYLMIRERGFDKTGARNFSNLRDIPSTPVAPFTNIV